MNLSPSEANAKPAKGHNGDSDCYLINIAGTVG